MIGQPEAQRVEDAVAPLRLVQLVGVQHRERRVDLDRAR